MRSGDDEAPPLADASGGAHSEDPSTALPESMACLELSDHPLLCDVLDTFSQQCQVQGGQLSDMSGFALGAVLDGTPCSPQQPCSNAYRVVGLPCPRLGSIPKPEIAQELLDDPSKDGRQRRDYGFPEGHTVPWS